MSEENKMPSNDLINRLRYASFWVYEQLSPAPNYEALLQEAADEIERLQEIEWMYKDLCN